ncbi:N-6 DNA methylase [Alkalibacter sp. M17DMB]|nr:N-6 DNA methylase [Alkalibacter mobilis]
MNHTTYLKELKKYHKALNSPEDQMLMVKAVFLKLLRDKNYITAKIDDRIFDSFKFDNILGLWAPGEISIYSEPDHHLSSQDRSLVKEYIINGMSLKNIDSIFLGMVYEYFSKISDKKKKGMYYTPEKIVDLIGDYHASNSLIGNKILDPACGSGFFLSKMYDKYMDQICKDGKGTDKYHIAILQDVLYGFDTDIKGILISSLVLSLKYKKFHKPKNIIKQDFLFYDSDDDLKFDIIVGNPPYIGHKQLDREYFVRLKDPYSDVFYDKGDISYCFMKRALESLQTCGKLTFVTSRYFMEAHNARGIRRYIAANSRIDQIIDYYGCRIIPGAKVDPSITFLTKTDYENERTKALIYRLSGKISKGDKLPGLNQLNDADRFEKCELIFDPNEMGSWKINNPDFEGIFNKMHKKSMIDLESVWESYQGVITGLDNAFVIDSRLAPSFPDEIAKPWIKNSHITKFSIQHSTKNVLYTDLVDEINGWDILEERLEAYKERLSKRRECKSGIRKWFHLQWGREPANFDQNKIVFPYKSKENRFALDVGKRYFSADIYGFTIKKNLMLNYGYKTIVALLNSNLYEFYFKSFGKKLGNELYEYYPNTVGKLKLPCLENRVALKLEELHDIIQNETDIFKRDAHIDDLNKFVYKIFDISMEEIKIIENYLNQHKRKGEYYESDGLSK